MIHDAYHLLNSTLQILVVFYNQLAGVALLQ